MAQRQITQYIGAGWVGAKHIFGNCGTRMDIAIGNLCRLGQPGGTGGKDHHAGIIGLKGCQTRPQVISQIAQPFAPLFQKRVETYQAQHILAPGALGIKDDQLAQLGYAARQFLDLVELFLILDEEDTCVGGVNQMLQLCGGGCRIHPNHNATRRIDPELGLHPFAAVFRQDTRMPPLFQPQLNQPRRTGLHDFLQPGPGDLIPDAKFLLPHRHGAAAQAGMVIDHFDKRLEAGQFFVKRHR